MPSWAQKMTTQIAWPKYHMATTRGAKSIDAVCQTTGKISANEGDITLLVHLTKKVGTI